MKRSVILGIWLGFSCVTSLRAQHSVAECEDLLSKARSAPQTESSFQRSLQCFRTQGSLDGQIRALNVWWGQLYRSQEPEQIVLWTKELLSCRQSTTSPHHRASLATLEARYLYDLEQDFAGALKVLLPHESYLSTQGPPKTYRLALEYLGRSLLELGLARRAFGYFRREVRLARELGQSYDEAWALSNSVVALREQLEESSRREDRRRALEYFEKTLTRINELGFEEPQARGLYLLAEIRRDATAEGLYQKCIDLSRGKPHLFAYFKACRQKLIEEHAEQDPEGAMKMMESLWAEIPTTRSDDLLEEAYDQHKELRVFWRTGNHREAWKASERVLDILENLRDAQPETYGRARSISSWAMTYYWIAGRLLRLYELEQDPKSFERAFYVSERMRARLLIDLLEGMDAAPQPSPELREKLDQRLEVIERINQLQRSLRLSLVLDDQQSAVTRELQDLTAQESSLQSEIHALSGRFADLERPDFAKVSEVQEALSPHEALFSFQLAPWESGVEDFAGGSWLLAITKDNFAIHRLPNSDEIAQWVTALHGRLDQGASAVALEERLHRELLSDALASLPAQVTDLVLIPDKALHRLPFAVLRESEGGPPLGARFRLSRIPSATLWLHRWRERQASNTAPSPVLVLADPYLTEADGAAGSFRTRGETPEPGLRNASATPSSYGPLPFARQEAWSIRRHLGADVEIFTGPAASERSLAELTRFKVLHFAAHAIANEETPELAGVILAPQLDQDGHQESVTDGLLQFNEIVDLELEDKAIVLSTCHSARGQILRGEGVFDLARAFFEGGARAVVGSLWRLEDRATARFFDDFYRHLARGTSLSEALHLAQRDQIARGAPPSAWAGIVVIGDGSLVPFPDPGGRHHPGWPIALALILLAVAAGVASRRSG